VIGDRSQLSRLAPDSWSLPGGKHADIPLPCKQTAIGRCRIPAWNRYKPSQSLRSRAAKPHILTGTATVVRLSLPGP
jgi:hypothetical protein